MQTDVSPTRLAEVISDRTARRPAPFAAYWIRVSGDRDAYADELRHALRTPGVVVLVVRDVRFDDPNSILFDLIRLLDKNRDSCESPLTAANGGSCAAVLVARSALSVPQASSPVRLPDWFPRNSGETISVVIEDLTATADAPLDCDEARIDEIKERLYWLEDVLLRRLREVFAVDKGASNPLLGCISKDEDPAGGFGKLLDVFEEHHEGVRNPTAFRPSLRDSKSLIARLWALGHQRNPEEHTPSKHLATALALPEDVASPRDSLVAVLRRPSTPPANAAIGFVRNVLATVASACQLVTAAAHADSYERYPLALLVSLSLDTRQVLVDSEQTLRVLVPRRERPSHRA